MKRLFLILLFCSFVDVFSMMGRAQARAAAYSVIISLESLRCDICQRPLGENCQFVPCEAGETVRHHVHSRCQALLFKICADRKCPICEISSAERRKILAKIDEEYSGNSVPTGIGGW